MGLWHTRRRSSRSRRMSYLMDIGGSTRIAPDTYVIQPSIRVMNFGGQRNQIHFSWLDDADLYQAFAPNYVWDINHTTNESEWNRLRDLLKTANPNTIIGYYYGCCTAVPEVDDTCTKGNYYKFHRIHQEDIEDETWYLHQGGTDSDHRVWWSADQPNRSYLDMTNSDVRAYVIALAVSYAVAAGLNAVSFDNCSNLYGIPAVAGAVNATSGTVAAGSVKSVEDWSAAFASFYEEAAAACSAANLKLIVNIAARANEIPEAITVCIDYVDAFMTEMAFHANAQVEPYFSAQLAAYESLVQAGKSGLLWMARGEDVTDGLAWIRDIADAHNDTSHGLYMCNIGTFEWHNEYLL